LQIYDTMRVRSKLIRSAGEVIHKVLAKMTKCESAWPMSNTEG